MISKPVKIKPLKNYKIWIKFADNTEGEVDLSDLSGKGVFKEWESYENFNKVYIDEETGSIAWTKEIELDANNLYLKIIGKTFDQWKSEHLEHAAN
jgi:hypothetical protein